MRLGGITLNVKDLEAAKDFYSSLPGAALVRDEPALASFEFGEARISLKQADEPGFHIEMESEDPQRETAGRPAEAEGDKVFLTDPDGHRIEVEREKNGSPLNHHGALFNPER